MFLQTWACLVITLTVVNADSDDHVHIKLHIPEVYKKHTHVRTVIKHHFQPPKKNTKVVHRLDPLSVMASSPLHLKEFDFSETFNKHSGKSRRPSSLAVEDADLDIKTSTRSHRGRLNKMRAAEKYRLMKLYEQRQSIREHPSYEQFSYQSDSEENDDYKPDYMTMQDSSAYGSSVLPTDSYSPNFRPSPTYANSDYMPQNTYSEWNSQQPLPTEESYSHPSSWISPSLVSGQTPHYSTLPDDIDEDDIDEEAKYQQFDGLMAQRHPMHSADDNRLNLYKVARKNPYNGIMKVKKKKYFSNIMAGY